MNAGVPIIKYIQIYRYYTTQSGNSDGKPTYLPLPHTFYSKRHLYLLYFDIYYTECNIISLKGNKKKFNYTFNKFNFVRDYRCYF